MPTFSPALITVMRSVLEDAMTQVSAEQATTVTKAYLAEFILKAAAEGLTNYEDLITAAMSGPDRGSPRPTVSSENQPRRRLPPQIGQPTTSVEVIERCSAIRTIFSNHLDNHRYTPPGGRVYLPVPATLPKIPVSDEGSRLPSS